jgi:hypothetical protein
MTNPFKKTWQPNLSEIHEYVLDLQRVSMLRDKAAGDERKAYDDIIHVMQEVLIFLNTEPGKRGK